MTAGRGDQRPEGEFGGQARLARDAPDAAQQRVIADIGRGLGALAARIEITQPRGLDRGIGIDRGLQQRGMKFEQMIAVGGRALRAQPDHLALGERIGDLLAHALRLAAIAALQVHRSGQRDQPADHRPGANLRFGDEHAGCDREHREHIHPGHMVQHEHAALGPGVRLVHAAHAHAHDPHQLAGPAPDLILARRGGEPREPHIEDPEAAQDMPREPADPAQAHPQGHGRRAAAGPLSRFNHRRATPMRMDESAD